MRRLILSASVLSLAWTAPALAADDAAAPGTAATAPVPDVPRGQLTDAVKPSAYRLDLTVDPAQERFSGKVEIDAVTKAPAAFVDLHGRDLAMKRAVAVVAGKTYPGTWAQVDPTGVARLTFAEPLPAGPVTFSFEYDAAFQSAPAGMFRVKVGDDWYSWTQLESIDARAVFPSFDQPGFKQPFTVTLRTRPGHVAVSNAPEVSKTLEGGLEVHRYAATLPLPTYLVAMMVGPFATLESSVPPTPQRAKPLPLRIVTTQQNKDSMTYGMEGSKEIVRLLEDYFNQSFPYPKLDQITTPILPGAMENAGADLYADPILILDESAPIRQKREFGMVVSHELAHQWFGDLVTPTWWDDIWLNESFANWMGYRIGNAWRPDLNVGAGALEEGFTAMNTDALLAGRAIHQTIDTNAQVDEAFDTITYGKGGHVVAMIAGYMGDERFRDGVRRYMAQHTYGNATSRDFFGAMADVAGDPRITAAMQSFTDQQGVPLLTFTPAKGGYRVTQSRYTLLGSQAPATRWGVPLCLRRVDGGERACQLLTDTDAPVVLPGKGPFIPNAGGTGYYRFELPRREWDALIATASRLPGGEAQALSDSLYASFRAGRATPGQLITAARELARNPDSYASSAGMDALGGVFASGMMNAAGKAGYRRFVERIFRPRLTAMGFDPRAGAYAKEDPEKSEQCAQVVGQLVGTARDAALRKQLGDAAKAYLGGNTDALDKVWLPVGLGVLVEDGGLDTAKQLAERALASQDPVFRPAALGAVGYSGKADIAQWVLDGFKDARLRSSERIGLVRGVISSEGTRDLGFSWLKANFDQLMASGGGIFFASRIPTLVSGFCSAERADEIAALLRPKLTGKTGALGLERTIERVRSCGVLKTARSTEVSRAFAKLK